MSSQSQFPDDWKTVAVGDAFEMQLGRMLSRASKTGRNSKPYLGNRSVQWNRVDVSELETMDFSEAEQERFALKPDDLLVCEWGVLKVSAIQPDGFRSEENKVIVDRIHVNPAYEVHAGDLMLSRSNTYQLVGIVSLAKDPRRRLMLCDKTLRLRFNQSEVSTEFMFWQLQQPAIRRQIEIHATGTSGSMKNISQPSIRGLKFAKPLIDEQNLIAERINTLQNNIRIETVQRDKLRKQKSGLMQDLLTGKVRVKVDEAEEVTANA
jgi:hypothetical protein